MEGIRYVLYDFGLGTLMLILSIVFIFWGIRRKNKIIKHLLFNFSAVFIALFCFELYYSVVHRDNQHVEFSGTFADNPLVSGRKINVGFGPATDTDFSVSAIRKNNEKLIYNVTYTFANGRRIIPNKITNSTEKVFFLGCSYVFGDGLNDAETLPYFFHKFTSNRFSVENYAFSGYGTHQALNIIENEIITPAQTNKSSTTVIYYFIPEHIDRAAGYSTWDTHGPNYEVEEGKIVHKGSFASKKIASDNFLVKRLLISWHNSGLYKSIFQPKVTNHDVVRVEKMIVKMKQVLESKGIRFIVIVDSGEKHSKTIHAGFFSHNNIEHYFVSQIIPDKNLHLQNYVIPGDGHPNVKHNSQVGFFLANRLK